MNYIELKNQRREKYNNLFNKVGVFYAFSLDQFSEGKKKNPLIEEGEKYVDIGAGGYIRRGKIEELNRGLEEIDKWYKIASSELKKNNQKKEEMIIHELSNYEAWYTGDITDTFEALRNEGITKEEILKVYKKNYKLQTANL